MTVHETAADGGDLSAPIWPGPLDGPEQALLEHAMTGEVLKLPLGASPTEIQRPDDFEAMKVWDANHTIHADVLRHLLIAPEWPVHAKGVRLQNARIVGELDLESAMLRCPLVLTDCYLDSKRPVDLDYATVSLLELVHCLLPGFTAELLIVTKELDLSRSQVEGAVRLIGASIAGQFSCRGTQITDSNTDGSALIADRITVRGNVLLDNGFTAAGAVRLPGANITGQLSCGGAQITRADNDDDALIADEVTVGGGVFLTQSQGTHVAFTAVGAVRLLDASITNQLNCSGAQITGTDKTRNAFFADRLTVGGNLLLNKGFTAAGLVRLPGARISGLLSCRDAHITGKDKDGDALMADRITVSGNVLLDNGFTAAGAVRLLRANVTGRLRCSKAKITIPNTRGNALAADGITVGSDVLLDNEFTAAGAVNFSGARIDGRLSLSDAILDGPVAFVAEGAKIGQQLVWAPRSAVTGVVSLERTQVHSLDDDWSKVGAYWPRSETERRLRLAGFVYDRFGGDHQSTCRQRLDWIRGQHPKPAQGKAGKRGRFDPQPYEQLANVYRRAGQDYEARQIAIAQRSDLRTYARLGLWRFAGNWLLDVTIRHGYRPLRAVGMLLAVYFVALCMFWGAQHQDAMMVPTRDTSSLHPAPTAMLCTARYPCFSPFGYAIDATIPVIKTGQADSWRPNAAAEWGWVYLGGTWVFTGLGWAFTTLAVAGYTGLIRKN